MDVSSGDGSIFMDFPADPPSQVHTKAATTQIAEAIGLSSDEILNVEVSRLCGYAVVEVAQSVDLASLLVDPIKLVRQGEID